MYSSEIAELKLLPPPSTLKSLNKFPRWKLKITKLVQFLSLAVSIFLSAFLGSAESCSEASEPKYKKIGKLLAE